MMFRYRKSFVFMSSLLLLSACKLVDQRTFNPSAGRRPIPYIPPPPPAPQPPAPPIEIVQGTPSDQWNKPLTALVRDALRRKPNALFVVTIVTPTSQTPALQQAAMQQTIQQSGQDVAQAIMKAGAKAEQIQMVARADGSVQKNMVQVDIR